MQRAILIVLAALTVGCGGDSQSAPRTFGFGGMDGAGGTAGALAAVPLSGLWSHAGASADDVFCFHVSADGTYLEAAGSPCGPDLAIAIDGGEDPCWFTVSTAAEVPIINNEFSLEGQGGDTLDCTFWSDSQVTCEMYDAEADCIRAVSGDLDPQ